MKVFMLFIALSLLIGVMHPQVRIGGSEAPEKGAILDLNGTYHGGLLLPNVRITDINKIPDDFSDGTVKGQQGITGLAGLLVKNISSSPVPEGIYVWDGTKWNLLTSECTVAPTPGAITGLLASYNEGDTIKLTCNATASGLTLYIWTVPEGLKIISGNGTSKVQLEAVTANSYPAGSISCAVINACGVATVQSPAVMINLPSPTITPNDASAVYCGSVTFKIEKPSSSWTNAQWAAFSLSNITATLGGSSYSGTLTYDGTYYYYSIATTSATAQAAIITVGGNIGAIPVTTTTASVQVQTNTASSFAVSGTKCFDINYFNVPGRTKADFSSSYIYKLSGVLGSNATISSVVWSYTNPKGAVAEFTPVATSTTPANNQVTVKYDPALLSDATIDATGIVVTITATITTVSSGCPNATYTINIPVKIRDAVCCPGVLIEGGVHTGPDMKAYSDGTPYSTLVSGTDNFTRIASQDLCVYYRDALNGSTKDFPWNDASSANGCANTTGGVYVDAAHASMGWRLPNIAELGYMQSLSTPTWDHFEDAPTYSGTANMLSYRYWSSTQHNNDRSMSWRYGSSYAYWYVNTSDGSARCVRIMD